MELPKLPRRRTAGAWDARYTGFSCDAAASTRFRLARRDGGWRASLRSSVACGPGDRISLASQRAGGSSMYYVRIGALVACGLFYAAIAQAMPAIAEYAKTPEASGARLSPSGNRYAIIMEKGGKSQILIGSVDGSPAQSVDGGGTEISSLEWAGEDHLIANVTRLVRLTGFTRSRAFVREAIVFNVKSNAMLTVFEHKERQVGGFVEGYYGARFVGGHWYGYFAGFSQNRDTQIDGVSTKRDLYRVDLDTGDIKMMSRGSDNDDDWLIGADGDVVARYQYMWDSGVWRVLAGPDGNKVLASGNSKFGGGSLAGATSNGEVLFARPPNAEGRPLLERLPMIGGPSIAVPDADKIRRVLVDTSSGLWLGYVTFANRPETILFETNFQARAQAAQRAFPGRSVNFESWSQDFSRVILFVSGGGDSGTHFLVDLNSRKAEPLAYAYEALQPADVGSTRVIEYRSSDGLRLEAVLTLPPGREARALPLVVLPNGGVGGRSFPTFNWQAQAFASRGYAVVQPNTRGSVGYGEDFFEAGFGELGHRIQTDMSDAAAELAKQGLVDSKRVCIVGSGWGGYAALAGITVQQGVYRCAVSMEGFFDLPALIANANQLSKGTNSRGRYLHQVAEGMGTDEHDLATISPARLAEKADAPALLIYTNDNELYYAVQNQIMADALRRKQKPVDVVLLPKGDTADIAENRRLTSLTAAVDFVEKHNPPSLSPSPP